MQQKPLGRTGLSVSELCLGSMIWGRQCSEAEGHAQIDMALDHGVTFIDTAEAYPVNPVSADAAGRTEEIIGNWFARSGRRDGLVLATKAAGEGQRAIRDGAALTRESLSAALDGSLRRLRTDVIDLYQIHWPNRGSYHFRKNLTYAPTPSRAETLANMQEILETAQDFVRAGKIRHFGLSNETVWGTSQWLALSDRHGLPRAQTIQNEYSLLCRLFDTDFAELAVNEDVTLLAYSPLAMGLLSGKYAGRVVPDGSRMEMNPTLGGRATPQVWGAVAAYLGIAARHGLDPCQMALAFLRTRPFPVIPIIGASTTRQLETNLRSVDVVLSPEVIGEIAAAHRDHPLPF